jgi:hypothetical protein
MCFDKQQYAHHHHQPSMDANQCLMSNVDNLPFEPLCFDKWLEVIFDMHNFSLVQKTHENFEIP